MVDKISPTVNVEVKQTGKKKYALEDKKYTQPHPELYEKFKEHPVAQKLLWLSNQRAHIANEAEQDMGILDKDVKATWPTNVELAKRRTIGRRRNMTEEELALWELHRNPVNGVPPADVRGSFDNGWMIDN